MTETMNWKSELLTVIFFQSTKRPVVAALFMKNHYKVLVRGVYQCQVYDTVALTCVFLDLCWYWVTLHLKPLISQGILYIIFFFFKSIYFYVFLYDSKLYWTFTLQFLCCLTHTVCFCLFFLSVPSVRMLYTQQGCDNNNPTVRMWLVLRCVCWTKNMP